MIGIGFYTREDYKVKAVYCFTEKQGLQPVWNSQLSHVQF